MTPQRTAHHSAFSNRGVLTKGVHIENSAVCAVSAVVETSPSQAEVVLPSGKNSTGSPRAPVTRGSPAAPRARPYDSAAEKHLPVDGSLAVPSNLRRLAEAIAAGADLTPEERAAAAEALRSISVVLAPNKPGQRSPSTRMAQAEHQRLLHTMAATFYANQSASAAAESIAQRLARYRSGPDWKRDRAADSITYRDTLRGHCWAVLKAIDRPLSARRIRALLATS